MRIKKLHFTLVSNQIYTPDNLQTVLQGVTWSQNSCRYDAFLTVLFSIWKENPNKWFTVFKGLENKHLICLIIEFEKMEISNNTLVDAHNTFCRQLSTYNYSDFGIGNYISMGHLCLRICESSENVRHSFRVCYNKHSYLFVAASSYCFSAGVTKF